MKSCLREREFQSSPGVSTGRNRGGEKSKGLSKKKFQSSPGVSTGRNAAGVTALVVDDVTGFNPRPAFPPGATTRDQGETGSH